jgi:hypothetical protein
MCVGQDRGKESISKKKLILIEMSFTAYYHAKVDSEVMNDQLASRLPDDKVLIPQGAYVPPNPSLLKSAAASAASANVPAPPQPLWAELSLRSFR